MIIIVKDIIRDNEWGVLNEETFFTYHTFSSFEKAKKVCMKDFNKIYHYYDEFKRHYPYHSPYEFYIPSIRKEKEGITIIFTIYPENPSFQEVVGDEKEPILQVRYRLIEVDKLPCD